MKLESRQYVFDLLSLQKTAEPLFSKDDFERAEQHFNSSCSQLVSTHSKHGVRICYFRVASGDASTKVCISSSATVTHALDGSGFGILLKVNYEERQYTFWLPSAPAQFSNLTQPSLNDSLAWLPSGPEMFCFDQHKRIDTSGSSSLASYEWQFQPKIQLTVSPSSRVSEVAVFPYVVMEDPNGQLFEELSSLSDVERHLYRKANWFYPRKPSDIWNYLIDGSLYDPRFRKVVKKRVKCQQCAYSWWSYFAFLHKKTEKKIYGILQDEVAYSVLLDMESDGKWSHGFWSADDIETHTRFQLDGIHLLISQYEKTGESIWLEAAKRGTHFVLKHLTEKLDDGSIWVVHDTVEHSQWKSTFFGKSPENSLCVNTHVQALTVLHRLSTVASEERVYAEMFESGAKALQRVLDYQPAEVLYRPLMSWVLKYITSKKHSKLDQVKNYLQTPFILLFYWSVRRLFPRIVQSNGFIERDLSKSFALDGYHIVNLKDLLTLYQQKPFPWLSPYITNGVALVRQLDLVDALKRNLQYIEWIDTLYMYSKLIEQVPPEEIKSVEQTIYQQTGGYSLDYYAAELVRGFGEADSQNIQWRR